MTPSIGLRTAVGFVAWCGYLAIVRPGVMSAEWGVALLLFAPLVLMPAAFELAARLIGSQTTAFHRIGAWCQLLAALLLVVAYLMPIGPIATLLAVPWSAVVFATTIEGLRRIVGRRTASVSEFTVNAACLFLAVGAIGVLLDRAGLRPLGFDPVIILLTGVHFHYAGFILPITAALLVRRAPTSRVARYGAIGFIAGIPLTGVGITLTQIVPWATAPEVVGVWILVAATMLVAWEHFKLGAQDRASPMARRLWTCAATSLIVGMAMAATYGSRSLLPAVFDIAFMRAVHGSINALGFATAALAGWHLAERSSSTTTPSSCYIHAIPLAPVTK